VTAAARRDAVPPHADQVTRPLSAAIFLQWVGASAILPMLPVYLRARGGSDALVGEVMSAFFVAGVVSQYPAGRLADRIGKRRVLLGGLLIYAAGSAAFVASPGPWADVWFRALQGAGAGAAEVAALAMLAESVPEERRGRASARIYSALIAGMAVGPLVGSVVGGSHMAVLFLGASAASLLACIPVLRARTPTRAPRSLPTPPPSAPAVGAAAVAAGAGRRSDRFAALRSARGAGISRALLGALIAGVAIGLASGIYETCWTLLLQFRHAADWEIGLSWTLFAVPFVTMSRPGGWAADHLDRRWLVTGSLGAAVALCAIYPFVTNLPLILALGTLEATFWAVAYPAAQSLLTQDVRRAHMGTAQGLFASSQTGATAVSAAAGGALFAIAPWVPFVATAAVAAGALACLPLVWRSVVGRAGRDAPRSTLVRTADPPASR